MTRKKEIALAGHGFLEDVRKVGEMRYIVQHTTV